MKAQQQIFAITLLLVFTLQAVNAELCQAWNGTALDSCAPFCGSSISWRTTPNPMCEQLRAQDNAAQIEYAKVGPGSDANSDCNTLSKRVVCAYYFPSCDNSTDYQLPCFFDCQNVDLLCSNTTFYKPLNNSVMLCALNNITMCNQLSTPRGPNIVLAIVIPLAILAGLVVIVGVVASVVYLIKRRQQYNRI